MTTYENEVKRGQDELVNEQRRIHLAAFWDYTDADTKALAKRMRENEAAHGHGVEARETVDTNKSVNTDVVKT